VLEILKRLLSIPIVDPDDDMLLKVRWHLCYNLSDYKIRGVDAAETCLQALKLAKDNNHNTILTFPDGSKLSVQEAVVKYELEDFVASYNHPV